jgi:hypothetical protein
MTDLHFSLLQWMVLSAAALIIGISKTGLPGIGILAIPMVAAIIPAKRSTGLILPMLIVGDVFAVAYYRRHAVWRHLLRLIPAAVAGIIAGYFALGWVNDAELKPIMGAIIFLMLAVNYWRIRWGGNHLSVPSGWWFPVCLGVLAGVTTMMANAAGPILIIYLVAMRLPKDEFLGTGAWYFLLLNCFKVPFSAELGLITSWSLRFDLLIAPLIVAGALLGVRLVKVIPERAFNVIVQLLAAFGALMLIVAR